MTYPSVSEGYKWVGVDLDGTLCERIWPAKGIGEPIADGVLLVRHYQREGYRVVLYTSRPWSDAPDIQDWLEKHDIPISQVVCGKLLVGLMVDDLAWRPPWAANYPRDMVD